MRARSWALVPIAVLLVLAALDLRWVGRLRDADVAHTRLVAHQRAEGLAQEFDNEVARAYDLFNTEPSTLRGDEWNEFLTEYDAWQAKASLPHLFRDWYVVHDDGHDGLIVRRFDPSARRFPEVGWNDELAPIRAAIEREASRRRPGTLAPAAEPHVGPEFDAPPALLIPLFPSDIAVRFGFGPAYGYVVGMIDTDYLRDTFLTSLARKYFGDAAGLEYEVEVVHGADPTAALFRSNGASPRALAPSDVEVRLFKIGFAHLDEVFLPNGGPPPHEGVWLLRATHRDGSIEAHVGRERRRDVILMLAVMGLLAASLVLLVESARRARRLAAQQTAFVAGVSHELRTPLAVIRSAGENLADGLVGEADRVRRYGALIADEGRRLSHLVEQAIGFAAMGSSARAAPQEVYDIAPVVEEVAAQSGDIARRIGGPLPSLRGDPSATRQVILSLIENAHKHAPASPVSILVDAIHWRGKPGVRIEVADNGGGIDPSDLPHVFEPFYRGRGAQRMRVPGSGLGLSIVKRLVQQQRGAISVRSAPGKGCTFIVCLPGA
jgi:signal transduction histidine kinase